jgi:hypothetical protein
MEKVMETDPTFFSRMEEMFMKGSDDGVWNQELVQDLTELVYSTNEKEHAENAYIASLLSIHLITHLYDRQLKAAKRGWGPMEIIMTARSLSDSTHSIIKLTLEGFINK